MAKTIEYKGKNYPVRILTMRDKDGDLKLNHTYTIADQTLYEAMGAIDEWGTEETFIDEQIYYYVDNGELELSAEKICSQCMDEEFIFVSEEI
jgi:hypothetical protein